jgi:hypothetical protein
MSGTFKNSEFTKLRSYTLNIYTETRYASIKAAARDTQEQQRVTRKSSST